MSVRENELPPLHVFRFEVEFQEDRLDGASGSQGEQGARSDGDGTVPLCSGAFAQCSGLEATMEQKAINEGGRNYGQAQRAGRVTFATVILRRGMTSTRDLWKWFELVTSGGAYAHRLAATVTMKDNADRPLLRWRLARALPVKFKSADLDARGSEVAVEELHLVHEGLSLVFESSQEGS